MRKIGPKTPGRRAMKEPQVQANVFQKMALRFRTFMFDSKLRKIYGKSPLYYSEKDVDTLIKRGEHILQNYGAMLSPTERMSVEAVVEKYKVERGKMREKS